MFKHTVLAILAVSLLTMGCSDDDTDARVTATSPAPLQLAQAPFAGITPSVVSAQLIGIGTCPLVQPFRVPVNLTLQASANTSLLLTEVRMHFVDTSGMATPQVTLAAPALTRQFGTALVLARSTRTFPLDFGFGCGVGRRGTLVVFVRVRDGKDRDDSAELRMGVR